MTISEDCVGLWRRTVCHQSV